MTSIAPSGTRTSVSTAPSTPMFRLGRSGWLGAAGAVLVSASSWWVGSVPNAWQTRLPAQLRWFAIGNIEPRIAFYAGLALMTAAWIGVGRNVLGAPTAIPLRRLKRTVLTWAAPMMVAIPLASRDLWAYATQGRLVERGFDPYTYAPIDMPGVFTENVSPGWVHSPAPYGPFWLALIHPIAAVYGEHVVIAVFLLRIPVLAGLLLLLWAVPRLADRAGFRADRSVWLIAASPFTIELVLGAGHNDLLLAGLMTTAAVLALRAGPAVTVVVPAAAVMALAAGVKSPAFIGLAFVVPLVLSRPGELSRPHNPNGPEYPNGPENPSRSENLNGPEDPSRPDDPSRAEQRRPGAGARATPKHIAALTVTTLLTGAVTFAAVTVITGFGLGWLDQVGSSASLVNWLSLPTDAAIATDALTGHLHGASHLDAPMQHWRTAGLALSAVLVAGIWLGAVLVATGNRRPHRQPHRRWPRSGPRTPGDNRVATVVTLLAAALLTVTLLGPAVQLWYLLWTLPFLGRVTTHRRLVITLVAIQTAMVFTVDPHGLSVTMKPPVIAVIALSAVVAWLTLRDVDLGLDVDPDLGLGLGPSPAADDDAHGPRSGVHADGPGHL